MNRYANASPKTGQGVFDKPETSAFDRVYASEHPSMLDVLELARKVACGAGNHEWADKLQLAFDDAKALIRVAERIRRADASGNNGAVMGEATLCRHFALTLASALEHTNPEDVL